MEYLTLTVRRGKQLHKIKAAPGSNLRKVLQKAGLSPYTKLTKKLNCGGRGICATCGVWIHKPQIDPSHWHDRLARNFGYARLSCQITIQQDMLIELDCEKRIWGSRRK
jgi:ferredoxin